jgi:predicted RND superfamily exporter protein
VIPLLFAMLFNFGFMGWSNIHLNIVTMLTSSIAIGVGVDYAVHFIHRYRLERKTMDVEKSVAAALHDAGVPIVLNAVTVGLGFAILTFSIFAGVEQMGLLIAIAMFTSCFGAIAILPVLFLFFGNKKEN